MVFMHFGLHSVAFVA